MAKPHKPRLFVSPSQSTSTTRSGRSFSTPLASSPGAVDPLSRLREYATVPVSTDLSECEDCAPVFALALIINPIAIC